MIRPSASAALGLAFAAASIVAAACGSSSPSAAGTGDAGSTSSSGGSSSGGSSSGSSSGGSSSGSSSGGSSSGADSGSAAEAGDDAGTSVLFGPTCPLGTAYTEPFTSDPIADGTFIGLAGTSVYNAATHTFSLQAGSPNTQVWIGSRPNWKNYTIAVPIRV